MMLRNILVAINSGYVHSNLAVRQLSVRSGIPFFEFNINMQREDVFAQIVDYDVLWFSCYIWNISFVYKLIDDIKAVDSGKIIVLGGPSVSFNAKEVMESHPSVDYIMCGEGEDIISPLAECIEKKEQPEIAGVLYRKDGKLQGSSEYRFAEELECVPYRADIVYFESSRGCPFSCSYCQSGFFKDGVRYYDLDKVKEALAELAGMNIPIVKFVDRTFNANEKRAAAILEYLLTLKCDTVWHFEIGGDLLTDRLINLLNKGNFQVEIGIQSFNEDTLKAVDRYCNLDRLCKNIGRLTIHKHVDLIAGLPFEDMQSFISSFNRAFDLKADMLQLGFLKVLPGSKMRNNKAIIFSGEPPYQVLKTDWISVSELKELKKVEKALDIYYNRGRFKLSLEYLLKLYPSPYSLFLHLADNFKEDIYLPIGYARAAGNMFFACKEKADKELLCGLMRCDYYFSGAKGNVPQFLKPFKYYAKDVRKKCGIEKDENFFISEVDYITREKIMCAVIKNTGRVIHLGEL